MSNSLSSNYRDLTVKVNETQIYIKDKVVYINEQIRTTLPFKNSFVSVTQETTVFIVISGRCLFHFFLKNKKRK